MSEEDLIQSNLSDSGEFREDKSEKRSEKRSKSRSDRLPEDEYLRLIAEQNSISEKFKMSSKSHQSILDAYFGKDYSQLSNRRSRASNNWVISGNLTKTGKPILANDPRNLYILQQTR